MERCSPVEMRKNLQVVDQFRKAGIDFVAIPVMDDEHKAELIQLGQDVLEEHAKKGAYTCEHEWHDADNEKVKGAEICTKCLSVRSKTQ